MESPVSKGGFRGIRSFWMLPSVRASALVFAGKVVNAGAGFLCTILIVRALGQRDFGLFSFSTTVMVLGWWLTGGTVELGLVRSFSAHADSERGKADAVLRVALTVKLAVGIGLAILGWFLAEPLAGQILRKPEFALPLRYGFVGALGLSLWGFILAALQALQAFRKYALGELLSTLLKLGLVLALLVTSHLTLTAALLAYILVSFCGFGVGMAVLPSTPPQTRAAYREAGRELLVLGKWLMISWLCASLHMRLDMLMLGYFSQAEALGVYALAFSLILPLDLLASTAFTVLLPKVSRFTQRRDHLMVLRFVLLAAAGLALLLLLLLPLAEPLILAISTAKFAEATPVLSILLLAPVFGLIGLSATAVLIALNKPQVLAACDGFLLLGVFAGNYLLIPPYGITGAAGVVLASRVVSGLGLFVYAYREAARPA